jgi:hypothetical protein
LEATAISNLSQRSPYWLNIWNPSWQNFGSERNVFIPDVIFPYTVRSLPSNKHTFKCTKYSMVPKHLQDRYDTMPVTGIAMDPSRHDGIALT